MSTHVVLVDLFGFILMVCGFSMAFRQSFVRRVFGWKQAPGGNGSPDAATYALRIAGVMIMAFGFALAMMVTLFSLA